MARRSSAPHEALPVQAAARQSGLSPDVIRIWERRYGVVAPVRGPLWDLPPARAPVGAVAS